MVHLKIRDEVNRERFKKDFLRAMCGRVPESTYACLEKMDGDELMCEYAEIYTAQLLPSLESLTDEQLDRLAEFYGVEQKRDG